MGSLFAFINLMAVAWRPLLIYLRVITVSPSWNTTVWRQVPFHQATCAMALQSKRLRVLYTEGIGNQSQRVVPIARCIQSNHQVTTNFP